MSYVVGLRSDWRLFLSNKEGKRAMLNLVGATDDGFGNLKCASTSIMEEKWREEKHVFVLEERKI